MNDVAIGETILIIFTVLAISWLVFKFATFCLVPEPVALSFEKINMDFEINNTKQSNDAYVFKRTINYQPSRCIGRPLHSTFLVESVQIAVFLVCTQITFYR